MMCLHRRHLIRAAIVAVIPLSITWCVARDNRLGTHFLEVSPGMNSDQVKSILGSPSWQGLCGARLPTGLRDPLCSQEFGYANTLAPFDPTYYLVWFGRDGRVIHTAAINSP